MGDSLELGDGAKDSLILEIIERLDDDGPRPPDANLRVRAKCTSPGGLFSAESSVWVMGEALVSFCAELIELHEAGEGEASLVGMVAADFELHVYSAKGGRLALDVLISRRQFRHEARLSFSFDPAQLAEVLSVGWLRAYAEDGWRRP